MILFLFILFLIVLALIVYILFNLSNQTFQTLNVYFQADNPDQATAAEALQYLKDHPDQVGSSLMQGVNLVPFYTGPELAQQVAPNKISITTAGSDALAYTFPVLGQNMLLSVYSTAFLPTRPASLLRFAIPDQRTFQFVLTTIPANTIVYYDQNDLWARTSAEYFQAHKFTIIAYLSSQPLPPNLPYLIIANTLTPLMIELVPDSCPKLYGLDGSIFYPLSGTAAIKATRMSFQCISYDPAVTSPLTAQVEAAIGKQTSYIFPVTLDTIIYAKQYLQGSDNQTIQWTVPGFTGSMLMVNNDRYYGNLAWYSFNTDRWILTETIYLDGNKGFCSFVPSISPDKNMNLIS